MIWIVTAFIIMVALFYTSTILVYGDVTTFNVYHHFANNYKLNEANIKTYVTSLENNKGFVSEYNTKDYSYAKIKMETGPYQHKVKVCIENIDLYKHGVSAADAKNCNNYTTTDWVQKIVMDVPCKVKNTNIDVCHRLSPGSGPLVPGDSNPDFPTCGQVFRGCNVDIPNLGDVFRGGLW